MNPEERLASIVAALESAGLACLVMGGHAVRYYGLQRNTIDFDLHLAPDRWHDLAAVLASLPLFSGSISEGSSWRPQAFRRFQIGRLPDGREEWLEFWGRNHLLPAFEELYQRREIGIYGDRSMAFLSLPDLIRSKETERLHDWYDIEKLEELLDQRHLAQVKSGALPLAQALAQIRSRAGMESFQQAGFLADPAVVADALMQSVHPLTQAWLLPFAPAAKLVDTSPALEAVVVNRLRAIPPTSPMMHLTLVEAVRRQYRAFRQEQDRRDKESARRTTPK